MSEDPISVLSLKAFTPGNATFGLTSLPKLIHKQTTKTKYLNKVSIFIGFSDRLLIFVANGTDSVMSNDLPPQLLKKRIEYCRMAGVIASKLETTKFLITFSQ